VNGLTRVNREQDIPLPDSSESRQVLRSLPPSDSSWGPQDSLVSLCFPPSLASASHVPRESHLAGSILLHSQRGLSPKDGQLYKRDACCLKHVRQNRTGALSRPRRAAAPRSHLFLFVNSPRDGLREKEEETTLIRTLRKRIRACDSAPRNIVETSTRL